MRMLNGSLPGSEVDRYTGFPYRRPDVRAAGVRVGRGEGSPKLREARLPLHRYPRRVLRSGSRGLRRVAARGRGIFAARPSAGSMAGSLLSSTPYVAPA